MMSTIAVFCVSLVLLQNLLKIIRGVDINHNDMIIKT